MPEIPEINDSLAELEQELSKLKISSETIKKAEAASTSVISECNSMVNKLIAETRFMATNVITENDALAKQVLEKTEKLIDKTISTSEKAASQAIKDTNNSVKSVFEQAYSLQQNSQKLSIEVEALMEKIGKVDFPTRLDKLDSTVSGINIAVQNMLGRLDLVERNLKDSLDGLHENLYSQFAKLKKYFLIFICIVFLGFGVVLTLLLIK